MESHPIPQNVTSFQFKLVGDMTLKQFGYLAVGLTIAFVIFSIFPPSLGIISIPLIIFFAGLGAAFAFLPINDRPLDHWAGAFIRAVLNPTLRIWYSPNITVDNMAFKNRLSLYMGSLEEEFIKPTTRTPKLTTYAQTAPPTQAMVTEKASAAHLTQPASAPQFQPQPISPFSSREPVLGPLSGFNPIQMPPAPAVPPNPIKVAPPKDIKQASPEELKKLVESAKKAQIIQNQIVETEHELNLIKAQSSVPGVDPNTFTKRFEEVLVKLQKLTQEANEAYSDLAKLGSQPQPKNLKVQIVPQLKRASITPIVLTSTPNIVNGIVTDSQKSYLEGVIVVAHDKEGLPVRALKTNKLGQFVAATPLPNGTYTLTFEKDNLSFDVLKVELDSSVMQPIMISAKRTAGG